MAATPLDRACPIRIVSVHLLDAAGWLLRVLFLDREGHFTAQPYYLPREEALILAANQQLLIRQVGPFSPLLLDAWWWLHQRKVGRRRVVTGCAPAPGDRTPSILQCSCRAWRHLCARRK